MSLRSYLDGSRGAGAQLAAAIGVPRVLVYQWAGGHRDVPDSRCPAVERATGGAVTCEQLRPDVRWHRVPDPAWPHPAGRPLIDVAAPAAEEAPHAA